MSDDASPQVPAPKRTFFDLLNALASSDEELAAPDFDPEKLVGDLRDKVDGIQSVLGRMENVAAWLKDMAKPLQDKARAITNNHDRLRKYVAQVMKEHNFQTVPGHIWKVTLRESPWAMSMLRAASALDYERFPGYVKMVRSYEWDTEKIKSDALAGMISVQQVNDAQAPLALVKEVKNTDDGISVVATENLVVPAKLTQGHWPDFKVNVPESLESKKGKKK